MIFSDPLPHVSLRGMVISKLLVFTHQAMVVAQLTALHLFTTYREADFANHDVRFGAEVSVPSLCAYGTCFCWSPMGPGHYGHSRHVGYHG